MLRSNGTLSQVRNVMAEDAAPITIKKYANRRLYDTASSSYVTLEDLARMVREGVDFIVIDARSGEDITRSVLTQIIVEEESKGEHLLPLNFLRQLIGFYGDNLRTILPDYLDHSIDAFSRNQDRLRKVMSEAIEGAEPFAKWEEIGRENLAVFQRAAEMWTPFARPAADTGEAGRKAGGPEEAEALDVLKSELEALQRKVEALRRKSGD